jgi:SAM-dependent methyltransferase
MDLKEVGQLGSSQDTHWYYASKARALLQSLKGRAPRQVLDVGAGTGFFAKMLLRDTPAASATCLDPGYPEEWSEVCYDKPIAFRRTGAVGEADVVLMMDVIEHVDDDVALVTEFARQARPRTRFVVSVPAFQWMWSPHDDFLEHRRRYTLHGARGVLSAAGLTPVGGFYFFGAVFPAVAAQRLWHRQRSGAEAPKSDLRSHHPWTNSLLKGICLAESTVARHNRAFGLTAFAVAEKR